MATAGASLRELMERMGHSTSRAALIYLHSTDERQRALAEAVARQAQAALDAAARGTYGARQVRSCRGMITPELSMCPLSWAFVGAPGASRTRDLLLRRQLLYPLSYRG